MSEPIVAEGKPSREEFERDHVRRHVTVFSICMWLLFYVVMGGVVLWWVWRPEEGLVFPTVLVLIYLVLFVDHVTWGPRRRARKEIESSGELPPHERFEFDEQGFRHWSTLATGEVSTAANEWGRVTRVYEWPDAVTLQVDIVSVLVPRRFFQDAAAWGAFLDLVRRSTGRSRGGVPLSREEPSGEALFTVNIRLRTLDVVGPVLCAYRRSAVGCLVWTAIITLGVLSIVFIRWMDEGSEAAAMLLLWLSGAAVLFVLAMAAIAYGRMRWIQRGRESENEFTLSVEESGVAIGGAGVRGRVPWRRFLDYAESRRWLLLKLDAKQLLILPRRCFDDAQWATLVRLVRANVGPCKRCGYPRRGEAGAACPECGAGV